MRRRGVSLQYALLTRRSPGAAGLALLAAVFAALVFSRRPAVILHAELWGDDGWSWYPDAYNHGLAALLQPVNGYLNTLQRLVGLAVQPFPLRMVPTLFAAAALFVQILPPVLLVSGRLAAVWPNFAARLLFALVLVVLPNEIEFYVNLTNAQWNLALAAFLVLVSAPPAGWGGVVFDTIVLLLSGLSGPFCLALAPVALWQLAEQRTRPAAWRAALVLGSALVQAGCVLATPHGGRSTAPLGAGPRTLARMLSLQVLLAGLLGYRTIAAIWAQPVWRHDWVPLAVAAAGAAAAAAALLRGPALLRKFALFAALLLAAALARPQASLTEPQWPLLLQPPMGNRYFTLPMLAWIGVFFALAGDRAWPLRIVGTALLLVMLLWAVPHDWQELPFPRTDFVARARAWDAAPPGTRMEFPIHPPGLSPMVLVKRGG